VQDCIRTIFSKDARPELLYPFIKTLLKEAAKPGIAASNAFVLAEWFSVLLQQCSRTQYWDQWGSDLLISDAQALELCYCASSKPNVKHTAILSTRRALRKVFSYQDSRSQRIADVVAKLTAKASKPMPQNAVMLGVVAGVCARKPELRCILDSQKAYIYSFYIREILGSRTPVPAHLASALHDFFSEYTTTEDVDSLIVPALEKGLLRAPEIVLDLVAPMFQSFPDQVDLSESVSGKLLKPLLSNIKSSNIAIRNGAINAFKVAITKCRPGPSIDRVADEILLPLKSGKLSAADQRGLHCEMLAAIPVTEELSKKILPSIATIAAKEANEVALNSETSVLTIYTQWCLERSLDIGKAVIDAFSKGLSEKKVAFRRIWTLRFAEIIWAISKDNLGSQNVTNLAEAAIPGLLDAWNEIIANPVAAGQSGLVTSAFVLTSLDSSRLRIMHNAKVDASLKKARVAEQALVVEPKPSFLLNFRVFTKLANEEDLTWLVRALGSVFTELEPIEADSAAAVAWAQAIIFCIASPTVSPKLRRQTVEVLSELYIRKPKKVASIIISGLWRWLQSAATGDKDSAAAAARFECGNLHLVVKAISVLPAEAIRLGSAIDTSAREQQMVSMLVIARPELLPRVNWIDLCLRVEVDPGELARRYADALIEQILKVTSLDQTVSRPFYCLSCC
jgi:hypothetical protein